MEIVDERNKKEIKLSELDCGELFTARNSNDLYLKSTRERRIEDRICIECINIENGVIEQFIVDSPIVPVEAKVVLT